MGRQRSASKRGFPPNLYQNTNGYFYYRNPLNGDKKGIGRDRAQAFHDAKQANIIIASMKKNTLVAWVKGHEDHTLISWLPVYESLWIEISKPADGTLATARRFFERIKKSDFAWKPLQEIETVHVAKYLSALEAESTASVVKNLRARLHDVFQFAENQGLIKTGMNPVSATIAPKYKVKRERLSLEQFLQIRERVTVPVANGMTLALMTGQRVGDVVNMKFSDYRDGFIFIKQKKTGYKLQQDGRIRLNALGMSIDEAIKQCRDRFISHYMIHHNRSSGTYRAGDSMGAEGLSNAFKDARNEVGIIAEEGRTPPSFHEIRSLAERLYKKEYGKEFAQAIMGHKHAKMTADYDDLRGSGWNVVSVK